MSYEYDPVGAQMGCDLVVCHNAAVGFAEVALKDHGRGGVRERLHLALCVDHILIGRPVERRWVDDSRD